jgi:TRAP-type mannitol/chloroaromatic compound transport system permease small subunit
MRFYGARKGSAGRRLCPLLLSPASFPAFSRMRLNALLDRITAVFAWLVLPLALLLFAQWPLRDAVGAGSRQANDLAQWLFALYMALALRHATRTRVHLAAGAFAARYSQRVQHWLARAGHAFAVLPFALFVLVSGWPMVWHALLSLEAFPDTLNPGYFLIKCAAWLLALAMALQAVADLSPRREDAPA